jgi:plasmid maintenance system antidote protein VapI
MRSVSVNGELLRQRLFERRKSFEWLAAEIDISVGTVRNMLDGKRVRPDIADDAAKALQLDPRKLAPDLPLSAAPKAAVGRARSTA